MGARSQRPARAGLPSCPAAPASPPSSTCRPLPSLPPTPCLLAQDHQLAVVDCLRSPDDTLKRKTLQLLYKMAGPTNIEVRGGGRGGRAFRTRQRRSGPLCVRAGAAALAGAHR